MEPISKAEDLTNNSAFIELQKKVDRIDLALLGPDGTGLHGGICKDIHDINEKDKIQESWTNALKPYVFTTLTTILVFALTWMLTHIPAG